MRNRSYTNGVCVCVRVQTDLNLCCRHMPICTLCWMLANVTKGRFSRIAIHINLPIYLQSVIGEMDSPQLKIELSRSSTAKDT